MKIFKTLIAMTAISILITKFSDELLANTSQMEVQNKLIMELQVQKH